VQRPCREPPPAGMSVPRHPSKGHRPRGRRGSVPGASPGCSSWLRERFAPDSRIEVLVGEPSAASPRPYGTSPSIWRVIYDGIWVGGVAVENLADSQGARRPLGRLAPAVIRWPGGCFATAMTGVTASGPAVSVTPPTSGLTAGRTPDTKYDPNHWDQRICPLADWLACSRTWRQPAQPPPGFLPAG
jgi:hypothetical protein